MILPFDDLNEMRQFPISLIIIAIIINGIHNHWICLLYTSDAADD